MNHRTIGEIEADLTRALADVRSARIRVGVLLLEAEGMFFEKIAFDAWAAKATGHTIKTCRIYMGFAKKREIFTRRLERDSVLNKRRRTLGQAAMAVFYPNDSTAQLSLTEKRERRISFAVEVMLKLRADEYEEAMERIRRDRQSEAA
jgi:hypothetical protein